MSLGYSNIAFPSESELDTLSDFYQANYHYGSNAVTASASVSESFDSTRPTTQTNGCSTAMSTNGNFLLVFEQRANFSITEGVGGTQTIYTITGQSNNNWRGCVYSPITDEFVIIGSHIVIVNAQTGVATTLPLIWGTSTQAWGGTYVDGKIYLAAYTSNQTTIKVLDMVSRVVSTAITIPSTKNFMASALDRDGTIVWGTEEIDPKVKLYNLITDTYSVISPTLPLAGYNGWAVLGDGRLWSSAFDRTSCVVYTPASMNNGTPITTDYSKGGLQNLGPWGMSFTGLDGNGYYVDSKGKSQLGGIYSDIYGFDYKTNTWFLTQFKMPAANTYANRSNQNTIVLPDGRILMSGDAYQTQYHTVKMFEPLNTITQERQVSGFIPNTSN